MDPDKLPPNFDQVMYWATWIVSLSVTASNGFLQLFSQTRTISPIPWLLNN